MTVGATHFALGHLPIDRGEAGAPPSQLCDAAALRPDVVKLEHDRIELTAIRARALPQDRVDMGDVAGHSMVRDGPRATVCLNTPPTGSLGRSATVAVRADDLAVRYFDLERFPRRGMSHERRNVRRLLVDVVELKDDRIRLPAIDARVSHEVLEDVRPKCLLAGGLRCSRLAAVHVAARAKVRRRSSGDTTIDDRRVTG